MIESGVGVFDLPVYQRRGGPPPTVPPTLDFSDETNSFYIALIFGGFA